MATVVSDPALLAKFKTGGVTPKVVTDPKLLEQFHGDAYLHPDDVPADNFVPSRDLALPSNTTPANVSPQTPGWAQTVGNLAGAVPGIGGELKNAIQTTAADPTNAGPLPAIAAGADAFAGNLKVVGPTLQALRDKANAAVYDRPPEVARAAIEKTKAENPEATTVGALTGQAAPYLLAATNPFTAGMMGLEGSLGVRLLMGGISSEALNTSDNVAHGQPLGSAVINATRDTAVGLPFYALGSKGTTANKAATIKAAPTVADLKAQANTLYDATKDSKLVLTKPAADDFINTTTSKAMTGGLDETLTPGATAVVKRMQAMTGRPMSIEDAMLIRKLANTAADNAPAGSNDGRISGGIVKDMDAFLTDATKPNSTAVASGDPHAAKQALDAANQTWQMAKKGQLVDTAIETAVSRSATSAGGVSVEQALRNEFGALERQIIKGQLPGFTPGEVRLIKNVAHGNLAQGIARFFGKFAPKGAVSSLPGLIVGGAAGGGDPLKMALGAGAVYGAGALGRTVANGVSKGNADYASAAMRLGAPIYNSALTTGGRALASLPGIAGRAAAVMSLDDWAKQQPSAVQQ